MRLSGLAFVLLTEMVPDVVVVSGQVRELVLRLRAS